MQSVAKDSFRAIFGIALSVAVLAMSLALSESALASGIPEYPSNINDDPTNFPPEAHFSTNTNSGMGRPTEGTIGTEFFFDARGSRDHEGTQLTYRWDFDGDGHYDTRFSTEPTISKVFWEAGTFQVKLAVRDRDGQFDHDVETIKIVRNTKPTSFFSIEPERGSPEQVFRFNASDSFDDQYRRNRLTYRWDFDGDGVYDTEWLTTSSISHTYGYGGQGVHQVTLQVKDPENQRDEYTRELEVLENTVPVAVLDIEPKVGTFNTLFRFSGEQSFDDETPFNQLKFRWDTDYNGPNDIIYDGNFSRGSYRKTLRFDDDDQRTGLQKIRMDVEDEEGRIGSAVAYVNLHWASRYLKILNDERVISTRYDADFNPDTPVPRGQVAEMILKKMGFNILGNTFEELFSDVPRHNRYARYIMKAKELGIVEGYPDGTFRPDSSISRSETLAMILRAFEIDILDGGMQFYPDVPRHEWFFKYVDTGTVHALVSGYDTGRFGPHDPITFGEITKILFQVGELNKTN